MDSNPDLKVLCNRTIHLSVYIIEKRVFAMLKKERGNQDGRDTEVSGRSK